MRGVARGIGHERRAQRVGRPAPGPVLGGMTGLQRERHAAVLQEDAQPRHREVRAEPGAVGLGERDDQAVAVDRVQVDRAAVARRRRDRARACRVDRGPAPRQTLRRDERGTVGVLVEHLDAVVSRLLRRLHQQMRPTGIVGIDGEVELLGDRARGQREVALRVGWDRPDIVFPHPHAQRRHPVRESDAQIVGACTHPRRARAARRRTRPRRTRRARRRRSPRAPARCPCAGSGHPRAARTGSRRGGPRRRARSRKTRAAARPGIRRARYRIAGASTSASESRPNRACSAHHPSTQPGTGTARMSPRNGMRVTPSSRRRAASAPEPARPEALSASGAPGPSCTRAKRSPPIPHMCCVVTASTAFVAIAASAGAAAGAQHAHAGAAREPRRRS